MYVIHSPESGTPSAPLRTKSSTPRSGFVQPAGWSEREAAAWLRDKSDISGGCLPSLTLNVGRVDHESYFQAFAVVVSEAIYRNVLRSRGGVDVFWRDI